MMHVWYICLLYCGMQIQSMDVILEDTDVAKALTQYVSGAAIENLVLGASKHGFLKLSPTFHLFNSFFSHNIQHPIL